VPEIRRIGVTYIVAAYIKLLAMFKPANFHVRHGAHHSKARA